MNTIYNNINDFITNTKKCIFCKKSLKVTLTNFIGFKSNGFPIIKSKIGKKYLKFILFNGSQANQYTNTEVKLDINSNILKFDLSNYDIKTNNLKEEAEFLKSFFEKISPHLEAYCSNKLCKYKYQYYICSDNMVCDHTDKYDEFCIKPFGLYMESFFIRNFWIQNDLKFKKLNIFIKDNVELDPVSYDNVDFSSLDEEKIYKKIMTLISFS